MKMNNSSNTKNILLKAAGISTLALNATLAFSQNTNQAKPNVVIIFCDDMGYNDVACYGGKGVNTPNIDSLCAQGVKFTSFYASQGVSSASRAALLTGCYSERVSILGALMPSATIGLSDEELTIPKMLKTVGYATGDFGKWHLGHHKEFLQLQRGFDEYLGLPYSNDMWPVDFDGKPITDGNKSFYPPLKLIDGNEPVREIKNLDDQGTLTTTYTERAVQFIEKNKNHPFFLYFAHNMPHVPLGVSDKYKGKSPIGTYGDVVMEIDWSVGEVMKELKKAGIDDNTIVIFTSDNGPWLSFGKHGGSAYPLREGKGTNFEGGLREPCIIRWPNHFPRGIVTNKLASTIDILPTLAAIMGAKLPSKKIDGVNILPLLNNEKNANPRNEFYYYYGGQLQGVRQGKWKLHFPHSYTSFKGVAPNKERWPAIGILSKIGLELFDLEGDVSETTNLADKYPEIVTKLQKLGDQAREDLGDGLTKIKGKNNREPGRIKGTWNPNVKNLAIGKKITLTNPPSSTYPASGNNALIDGKRGTYDYNDGIWQGWEGDDMEAIIDLGEAIDLTKVSCSFFENTGAWIYKPQYVEVFTSNDNSNYNKIEKISVKDVRNDKSLGVYEFFTNQNTIGKVRYIKLKAKNIGIVPKGHPGTGGKAWLFADEIIIE